MRVRAYACPLEWCTHSQVLGCSIHLLTRLQVGYKLGYKWGNWVFSRLQPSDVSGVAEVRSLETMVLPQVPDVV